MQGEFYADLNKLINKLKYILLLLAWACSNGHPQNEDQKIIYFPGTERIQQIVGYKHGLKNGRAIEYYKDGTTKARQFYVNDQLDDTSLMYYPDGKVKSIQVYKNRIRNGCWKEFNKEGHLYSEIFFKDGFLDSTSTIYTYRTGKILTRITYKNGAKNGWEEHYYNNGNPKSKASFDHGIPCAGLTEWTESGKEINNDFKVKVIEKNEALLNNKLRFIIMPENPQKDDKAYLELFSDKKGCAPDLGHVKKVDDHFELEYNVANGGFVMEEVKLIIHRRTGFGNIFVKTFKFKAAYNHF